MFQFGQEFPGQSALLLACFFSAGLCAALLFIGRSQRVAGQYYPLAAWLRAGVYFSSCLLIAAYSGVLAHVLREPLVAAGQTQDWAWCLLLALCVLVVVIAYGCIWPRGTFHDGRASHPLLSALYGAVWGVCQALLFLSFWAVLELTGWPIYALAILAYVAIGAYNGLWHHFFWDVYVSPPHNYSEWNGKKVMLCHTPNLIVSLSFLALYGNAALFVFLQSLALAISAYAMRFPAPWDAYRAQAGQERSLAER